MLHHAQSKVLPQLSNDDGMGSASCSFIVTIWRPLPKAYQGTTIAPMAREPTLTGLACTTQQGFAEATHQQHVQPQLSQGLHVQGQHLYGHGQDVHGRRAHTLQLANPQKVGPTLGNYPLFGTQGSIVTRLARSFPSGMEDKSKLTLQPWSTSPPRSSDLRKKMSSLKPGAVRKPNPFWLLKDLTLPSNRVDCPSLRKPPLKVASGSAGASAVDAAPVGDGTGGNARELMAAGPVPVPGAALYCFKGEAPSAPSTPGKTSVNARFSLFGGGSASPTSRARHFPHLPSGNAWSQKHTVDPTSPQPC
mmetsp:Transcript_29643/g.81565  ORF Transcript_29643/g.81565 Transcript_29643/m.81565 type:complete len:305 (-) Transcript_29643:490-1404(-)